MTESSVREQSWFDSLLVVLSRRSTRQVLAVLEATDEERLTLDLLVDELTERTGRSSPEWERDLYHIHLPALADQGLLVYDWESGHIEYGSSEPVQEILAVVRRFAQE